MAQVAVQTPDDEKWSPRGLIRPDDVAFADCLCNFYAGSAETK